MVLAICLTSIITANAQAQQVPLATPPERPTLACDPGVTAAWGTRTGPNVNANETYKLVFFDEFDGTALDRTKWDTRYANVPAPQDRTADWGGGQELQYYDDNNVTVSGGSAHLRGEKLTTPVVYSGPGGTQTKSFKSGMLFSKQQYLWGRIEMRCRVPASSRYFYEPNQPPVLASWIPAGYKPAFWLIGGCCGNDEVDIFEIQGDDYGGIQTTLHENLACIANSTVSDCGNTGCKVDAPTSPTNYGYASVANGGYHTYAVEWEGGCTKWYYDGTLIRTVAGWWNVAGQEACDQFALYQTYAQRPASPDEALTIIANLQIIASAGDPNGPDAVFPGVMDIDFIRVYQKLPDGTPRDLCNTTPVISGQQTICSSSIYLTSSGTSAQQTATWTASPNLYIISQSANSILVDRRLRTTTSEAAYVELTVTGGLSPACPSTSRIIRYPIWIGPPSTTVKSVIGACGEGEGTFSVPEAPGALYAWTITGATVASYGSGNSSVTFGYPPFTSSGKVVSYKVTATNGCSTTTKSGQITLPGCTRLRPAGRSMSAR
ncbi:MAG: glycoside hydrolase family 16 protein [Hymenobacteraceae bacterium]|nr:glycoside hydrolase family 16 protein [Hymenobacteraceae bacterium]